jgi:heterotetrameric sarcosine oxidase gamma subunit
VSKPERRSVLEGYLVPGHNGATGGEPVELREMMRDAAEFTVRKSSGASLRKAAKAKLKLDWPAVGRWSEAGGLVAMGTGPGGGLVIARPDAAGVLVQKIDTALGEYAAIVETGHGLAFLALSGAQARHVLAKGCRLDLHANVFKPGDVARTIIAQIPATLWQIDDAPTFGLAVPVTFAHSFVHFLLAASAETGCTILPASKD